MSLSWSERLGCNIWGRFLAKLCISTFVAGSYGSSVDFNLKSKLVMSVEDTPMGGTGDFADVLGFESQTPTVEISRFW